MYKLAVCMFSYNYTYTLYRHGARINCTIFTDYY